jgi:hypothetical protein
MRMQKYFLLFSCSFLCIASLQAMKDQKSGGCQKWGRYQKYYDQLDWSIPKEQIITCTEDHECKMYFVLLPNKIIITATRFTSQDRLGETICTKLKYQGRGDPPLSLLEVIAPGIQQSPSIKWFDAAEIFYNSEEFAKFRAEKEESK